MKFSKKQRVGLHIVVTAEDITAEQIREAADRWPHWISSERSANALGLPESHTPGGLPLYPPANGIHEARASIAAVITAHWSDPSNEHTTEWSCPSDVAGCAEDGCRHVAPPDHAPLAGSRCGYETHPCRDPRCARCGAKDAK